MTSTTIYTDVDRITTEISDTDDNQNMQMDSQDVERDDLASTREKRLRAMCYVSVLSVLISLVSIVVGSLAILTSITFPYRMGGGVIAGGMAMVMAICPFCMYIEGKETGNKMNRRFKCYLISFIIWFNFCACGILIAIGMSGLWGMIECIKENKNPGKSSSNLCKEETSEKLIFSVLTLVLSALLLIITNITVCLFCCNKKAFGYKTLKQRRYEYYRHDRAEIQQEIREERTIENRNDTRGLDGNDSNITERHAEDRREWHVYCTENERDRPKEPSAPPLEDTDNRDVISQEATQSGQIFEQGRDHFVQLSENRYPLRSTEDQRRQLGSRNDRSRPDEDRHRPRRPDNYYRNRPCKPNEDRHRPRRPDDYNRPSPRRPDEDRHRPRRPDNFDRNRPHRTYEDGHRSDRRYHDTLSHPHSNRSRDDFELGTRFVSRGDKNGGECRLDNQTEAPPPSYDEVVNKYIKADDV